MRHCWIVIFFRLCLRFKTSYALAPKSFIFCKEIFVLYWLCVTFMQHLWHSIYAVWRSSLNKFCILACEKSRVGIALHGRFRAALFSFSFVTALDLFFMVSILSYKGRFKQSLMFINFTTGFACYCEWSFYYKIGRQMKKYKINHLSFSVLVYI